jgi:hypothetical protein
MTLDFRVFSTTYTNTIELDRDVNIFAMIPEDATRRVRINYLKVFLNVIFCYTILVQIVSDHISIFLSFKTLPSSSYPGRGCI